VKALHTTALLLLAGGCWAGSATEPVLDISIVSPVEGARYEAGDTIRIAVVPNDPATVGMSAWFYVDGRLTGIDSVAPYELLWPTTDATPLHPRIMVRAFDLPRGTATRIVDVEVTWRYRRPPQRADGWTTATLEEVGLRQAPLDSLVSVLRGRAGHLVHGIAIARHGKLVFEKYFDGLSHPTFGEHPVSYGPTMIHGLSSVTKSYTATLLGAAIERGCIGGVSDRVLGYYPVFADLDVGLRHDITLRDLVTMTSGLQWDEHTWPLTDERNDLTAWLRHYSSSTDDPARAILERPMVATPGTVFNYAGGSANVLGNAIQRACGMRLDRFADQALFDPLGVRDAWWWIFPSDFVYASGDLALRPRDMLKLGQLHLRDGVWNGIRILPPGWVEIASAAFSPTPEYTASEGITGYGWGWWSLTDAYGAGAYEAWGWGGQYIIVMPAHDMVVALTGGSYWTAPWKNGHRLMTDFILHTLL
jgi:CubicO group peptidase (beta-lactamase class C family)